MMELRQSRFLAYLIFGVFLSAVTACGGGGGTSDPGFIGGGADDPGGGEPAPEFAVTLALTDGSGQPIDRISASTPGVLTVTLSSTTGGNVASEVVSVATFLSTVLPSSGSQLSDENGVAIFQILAAGNSGIDTITANALGLVEELIFEVDADLSITLTDQNGNDISNISSETPGIVTVTSSDSLGNPIQGDLVTATATAGLLAPGSRLTDGNGEAIFSLEAAGGFGAGTVSASSGNRSAALNFEIVSLSGETNRLELTLTDSQGNEVTSVTSINPGVLTVLATDETGLPLANQVVNASATIGVLSPDSGTALTDLGGVATFSLTSDGSLGAGTATASLGAVSDSLNFQIGEASLRVGRFDGATFVEGEIEAGSDTLPAAGSTPLSVAIVDPDDVLVTSPVQVAFSSGCASLDPPLATISEEVTSVNGIATSTYTAAGCTGTDNITATIGQGSGQSATSTVTIATADVNSIAFISATPNSIALKGTGGQGREESSRVAFQVVDNTGAPVAGIDVGFVLSTTVGGLTLTNDTATTNETGIAEAIVLAGNVSTSVRVTATITVDGEDLSTVSDQLVVSTGLPDQNSISLATSLKNPGGGNVDGVQTTLSVRMADKFNNPVPDGTVAFFTSEFGAVDPSCELTNGVCTVTWRSQEPRLPLIYNSTEDSPPDSAFVSTISNRVCSNGLTNVPCIDSLGPIFGRRSQITVIAVGEESFIDVNGNGLYDVGEPFDDLPEAWLDKNENGQFDNTSPLCTIDSTTIDGRNCAEGQEEIYFDFDEDGVYDQGNGLYNGSLCTQALADSGDCSRDLVHVRDEIITVMSGAQSIIVLEGSTPVFDITLPPGGSSRGLTVVVGDFYNNLPSGGATVSITAEGCEISGEGGTVPDTNRRGAYSTSFSVIPDLENTTPINGAITVTLEGSVGSETEPYRIGCFDDAF
jgi:hypothetical protein